MQTFKDQGRLFEVIGGFFEKLADTPSIADKLLESKLIFRMNYTEPDGVIVVDCTGEQVDIRTGDSTTKAHLELSMKSDVAHKFWFGKVNLTMALATKKIRAEGPIPKMLKLLPLIKPAYSMYPTYLEDNGFSELNFY